MNARITLILGAVLIAGAIGAGCGDDDSASTSPGGEATAGQGPGSGDGNAGDGTATGDGDNGVQTSSLSKQEFLKQASAECRQMRKSLLPKVALYLKQQEAQGVPPAVANARMAREVFIPGVEAEIALIRELGAPAGDEEKIEELLAMEEDVLEEVGQLKKASSLEEIIAPFEEASEAFRAYGFTGCTN